jgi:hypothetical protein
MASDYPFGIFRLFVIVLSILLLFMASDYPFDIIRLFVIVLSILLLLTASDYPFGIFRLFAKNRRRIDNTITKSLKIPKG